MFERATGMERIPPCLGMARTPFRSVTCGRVLTGRPFARMQYGGHPLLFAARGGHWAVVKILLEAGAAREHIDPVRGEGGEGGEGGQVRVLRTA